MRDLIADRALRDQLAVIVGGDDFLATLGAKDMLATLALTVLPEAIDRALTAEAEVEARGKVITAHHKEMLRRNRQVDDLKALLAAAKVALCNTCPATCRLPECFCTIVPEIDAALEAPHA
jgi:hypothetical protein